MRFNQEQEELEPFLPMNNLDIKPDIMCCAKGIGGGIPIGAILTSTKIAECMQLGSHGSTFGGNPLACAVAEQVMTMLSKKSLLNGVKKKEKLFLKELKNINKEFKCFERNKKLGFMDRV